MRSTAKALSGLLLLAQKGRITISGRGVNEESQPLYEVREHNGFTREAIAGFIICHNATEDEVIAKLSELAPGEKEEAAK